MSNETEIESEEASFAANLKALTPEQFKQATDIVRAEEARRDNGKFAKKLAHMSDSEFNAMTSSLNG